MKNQETQKKNYLVTATANPNNFEDQRDFQKWEDALKFLNEFIYDMPMSIEFSVNDQVVKVYNFKQRVRLASVPGAEGAEATADAESVTA